VANVGDSLRRLYCLQHRIYNLLGSNQSRLKCVGSRSTSLPASGTKADSSPTRHIHRAIRSFPALPPPANRILSIAMRVSVCLSVCLSVRSHISTRSSAIAEGPRDASCQVKSCQLARNDADTTRTTSPERFEVMKLEADSGPMCNKHVHSTMTRYSRFHCPI